MKLNCDMGEGFGAWQMGADEQLMPHIDMANIACGMHASDPATMHRCVELAVEHGVSIGAHPGYPDLAGFGRRDFPLYGRDLEACMLYQIGALEAICQAHGSRLEYVKPHGALYNKMMRDRDTLETLLVVMRRYNPSLPLVVQAGTVEGNNRLREQAQQHGVTLFFEAFADRRYGDDGLLIPRSQAGAVHQSVAAIAEQARQIIHRAEVQSLTGTVLKIDADTLCIHGDNPLCVEAVTQLRQQ